MLAKAILQGQDLLLLDEPTNHLDLPTLRWLEGFINDTQAAVAVISHDRYFLDRIATSILEIELGRSRCYEGNYTDFMEKKEQELEIAERHFERQQDYIKKQEEVHPAQHRRPEHQDGPGPAHPPGQALAPGEAAQGPPADQVRLPGDPAQRRHRPGAGSGQRGLGRQAPVRAPGAFPGQARPEAGHRRPERHRQVHPAQGHHRRDPVHHGGARLGSQVKLGYFDQHHRNLDPRNTVYQQIQAVVPMAPKQDVLGFLAKFPFRGDEVDKPVTVLSGGERARLSVATLIREGVNLLLLDEPTNHMDIHSMEAMEDTILSFTGAVVAGDPRPLPAGARGR